MQELCATTQATLRQTTKRDTNISFQQLLISILRGAQKWVGINRGTEMLGAVKDLQEHETKGAEIIYRDLDATYNKEYKAIKNGMIMRKKNGRLKTGNRN